MPGRSGCAGGTSAVGGLGYARSVRKIGFAYNPSLEPAAPVLERARRWCDTRGVESWVVRAEDFESVDAAHADSELLCVLGGDGTFLRTVRAIGDSGIPTLGVNLGRIGFLAKVEAADLEHALDQVWRGEYGIQERMRLEATIQRASGEVERHACVNDVAIARGAQARVVHLAVDVSGIHLATYVADGVVVATPTGSTAYSFSAGGPILDPSLRNLVVTPIAAYLTAIRSVVVGDEHRITVTRLNPGDPGVVSLDGQFDVPLVQGDRVDVRALDDPLRLVEPAGSVPFYDLLRTKATLLPR